MFSCIRSFSGQTHPSLCQRRGRSSVEGQVRHRRHPPGRPRRHRVGRGSQELRRRRPDVGQAVWHVLLLARIFPGNFE